MARPPASAAHRIPSAPAGGLLGRSAEIAQTLGLLERPGVVTLMGLGGVGKTRIALETAALARTRGWTVAFADLRGLRDARLVPGEAAAALGVDEALGGEVNDVERIAQHVAGRGTTLLVLDNLEQLAEAGEFIARLAAADQLLRILGTSRIEIPKAGGAVIRVAPLELPATDDIQAVRTAPATALFIARAREVTWLDPEDAAAAASIARLCHRLGGLPLAIELVASRSRLLTPRAIERRLVDGRDSALLSRPGDEGAHRSLDAVFEWTFELLGAEARRLLMSVAICVSPFDLSTAARLCPDVSTLDALEQLVATSLVVSEPDADGEPRLRMLEVVRQACLRRLSASELDELRDRHLREMVEVVACERDSLLGADRVAATARLVARLDDLRSAFDTAMTSDTAAGIALVSTIWRFWASAGRREEAIDRLRHALQLEPGESRARAWALAGLAGLVQLGGSPGMAATYAGEAVRVARRAGAREPELDALPGLVLAAIAGRNERLARTSARRALALARALGDGRAVVRALATIGLTEGRFGNYARGVRALQDAIEGARLAGDPLNEAIQLDNLAQLEAERGRWREALVDATASVALLRGLDRGQYLAGSLLHLGRVLTELGRLESARDVLAEGLRLALEDGSSVARATTLPSIVPYLERVGAIELAVRTWGVMRTMDAAGTIALTVEQRAAGGRLLERVADRVSPTQLRAWVKAGESADLAGIFDAVEALVERPDLAAGARAAPSQFILTPREGEILRLLGEGMTDSELGDRLSISPKTASVHVANIKAKLGVRTRLEVAMAGRALMDARGEG